MCSALPKKLILRVSPKIATLPDEIIDIKQKIESLLSIWFNLNLLTYDNNFYQFLLNLEIKFNTKFDLHKINIDDTNHITNEIENIQEYLSNFIDDFKYNQKKIKFSSSMIK